MKLDFAELANQAIAEMAETEELENLFKEKVKEVIKKQVEDQLRGYSKFGKFMETAIQEKMGLAFREIQIPDYGAALIAAANAALTESVLNFGKDQIKAGIEQITSGLEKKVWKMSEVVEKMKEFHMGDMFRDDDTQYEECSFKKGNGSHGYTHFYMDPRDSNVGFSEHRDYRIMIENETGRICSVDYKDMSENQLAMSRKPFSVFLFKLWASGSTIEVDNVNLDYTWPDDECHCD